MEENEYMIIACRALGRFMGPRDTALSTIGQIIHSHGAYILLDTYILETRM